MTDRAARQGRRHSPEPEQEPGTTLLPCPPLGSITYPA